MNTEVTVGELVRAGALLVNDGYRTKRAEHSATGYRIIRVADVKDDQISFDGPDFVSRRFEQQVSHKAGRVGDVLLTTKGTVGRVAIMPEAREPVVYSPQLCFFRVLDETKIDRRYLRYWFSSREFFRQAADRMNNTDMAAYINLVDIRSLNMTLPEVHEQRALSEVLGALDDKIAANASLVATLDGLRSTRILSMLADAQERPLSETAEFINGKAFTKGASGTGRVVVRIAELNNGVGGSTVLSDADVAGRHLARPGDVLFAWSGSLTLRRWFRDEAIVNQHIFKVVPREGFPKWLVFALIDHKLAEFKAIAADKATTMGHIQRRHLDEFVPVPSPAVIGAHDAAMTALWDRALLAERESLTLAELRDTLLPELMSGRLRVKDLEKAVGEVV